MSEPSVDIPKDRECVGPESEQAGKAAACAGCPNASLCASGALKKGPDPDIPLIAARLRGVRLRLLILSGKGGVGKSSVTKELALGLARRGLEVGVLDADLTGSSMPRMLGAKTEEVHHDGQGISPVGVREGVSMMSIHYLMHDGQKNDSVTWRGPQKNQMLKDFLKQVNWSSTGSSGTGSSASGPVSADAPSSGAVKQQQQQQCVDCLLIDTPPGTTDEHITLASLLMAIQKTHDAEYEQLAQRGDCDAAVLEAARVRTCAIVVTTPQQVAVNDVRRELSFCVKAKVPVLGLVVNMDGFVCPCCKKLSHIFPNEHAAPPSAAAASSSSPKAKKPRINAADALAAEFNIPVIGRLPLDPSIMMASDSGKPLVEKEAEERAAAAAAAAAARRAKHQNGGDEDSNGSAPADDDEAAESAAVTAVEDLVDRVMDLCDL